MAFASSSRQRSLTGSPVGGTRASPGILGSKYTTPESLETESLLDGPGTGDVIVSMGVSPFDAEADEVMGVLLLFVEGFVEWLSVLVDGV